MSIENPTTGEFILWILGLALEKITVPTDYHTQCQSIEKMLVDDSSGLINSLLDFAIESASVNYEIITGSNELNNILKEWLKNINKNYYGLVPKGVQALAEEANRERFKGSSFLALKMTKWEKIGGIKFPVNAFFVNGGSIYATEKKGINGNKRLINYDYYLDKALKQPLGNGVIIQRPFTRWYKKYPVPYLFQRGVYHNWKLMDVLKSKQGQLLDQVIPLITQMLKGNSDWISDGKQSVPTPEDLNKKADEFKKKYDEIKKSSIPKALLEFSPPDEEWKHIVPDITKMFAREIPASIEKNILAGLGFIDAMEAVTSSSRRESILNPQAFVSGVKKAVEDFGKILEHLLDAIIDVNDGRTKYVSELKKAIITHDVVQPFMTDKFKQKMTNLYDRGNLSKETYTEIVGDVNFELEKYRRTKELEDGVEILMYPHLKDNREKDETPEEILHREDNKPKDVDVNGNPIPPDKIEDNLDYDYSKLVTTEAPFKNVKELEKKIPGVKKLSPGLKKDFLKIFNNAYNHYHDDVKAIQTAWSIIKKVAKPNDKGIWVRVKKKIGKRKKSMTITRAIIENVVDKIFENKETELVDKIIGELEE